MYLNGASVLPDGFVRFGHAFGSDPWISLLLHANGACEGTVIVNSLALDGYYAIAELACSRDTTFRLEADVQ
jgi:hypothetical protein